MAHLVKEKGFTCISVSSAATSTEEIGNPVHPGTKRVLSAHGVPLIPHRARQMTRRDAQEYDYLIGMDAANLRNMARIAGSREKIHGLLDWSGRPGDIADPWYTGDFETTFADVWEGCTTLLAALEEENKGGA